MRTPAEEGTPLTLILQRLMDADLLLPEEGSALITEAEAFDQAQDKTIEERASESRKAFLNSIWMLKRYNNTARLCGMLYGFVRQYYVL